MSDWTEIGLSLFTKVTNKLGDREVISKGLMVDDEYEEVLLEPKLQFISDPLGEPGWPTGAYGVVRSWKGRCGLFHVDVPFTSDSFAPEIHWLEPEITNVQYFGRGKFILKNVLGKVVGAANMERGIVSRAQ